MLDIHERTESAPVLLVFGCHAARMGRLIRLRPSLLKRVAFAPRRAVHAIGAFLYLDSIATQADSDVARLLDENHPRDLLRTAIPDAPPRLYRALERAGDRVKGRRFYGRLATLCRTSLSDQLLDGELHELQLSRAEKVLALDPALAQLPNILLTLPNCVDALDVLIGFLRAQVALRHSDLKLPPNTGLSAIVRRLLSALDNVVVPPPTFEVPPPFRVIQSVGELRRAGSNLRNCIGQVKAYSVQYWLSLASGDAIYITSEEQSFIACIRRCGEDVWYFSEIGGLDNHKTDDATRLALLKALKAAGARLLEGDPARALSLLIGYE
jgi:hypothetical protein